MSGELFVIALLLVFAALIAWLAVQIVNRERWAVPIAVGLAAAVSVIVAVLASVVWMSQGV